MRKGFFHSFPLLKGGKGGFIPRLGRGEIRECRTRHEKLRR
jgi:hypothetical protein